MKVKKTSFKGIKMDQNASEKAQKSDYHARDALHHTRCCMMMHVIIFEAASFLLPFHSIFSLSPQFAHFAIFPLFFDHSSLFLFDFVFLRFIK